MFSAMARKIDPPRNWKNTAIEVAVVRSEIGISDIRPINGWDGIRCCF